MFKPPAMARPRTQSTTAVESSSRRTMKQTSRSPSLTALGDPVSVDKPLPRPSSAAKAIPKGVIRRVRFTDDVYVGQHSPTPHALSDIDPSHAPAMRHAFTTSTMPDIPSAHSHIPKPVSMPANTINAIYTDLDECNDFDDV